jgi:hypothetical protein
MSQDANSISAVPTDDPESGSTWVVTFSAIIILSALVIATCVFYFKFEDKEIDVKVIAPPNIWMTQLKNEQLAQLDVYQKYSVTAPDGSAEPRIRIPITKAMEFVIADAKNPPKIVVATPVPASVSTGTDKK